jgi:hypothetical protein
MRPLALPRLFAAASLLVLGCQTAPSAPAPEPAKGVEPASSVFEPARGVRCDRATKVCQYRGGPTVGLTRLFFGDESGDRLAQQMSAASYPYDRIFTPAPRSSCDTLVTTCYEEGGASVELTRKYFGSEAAARLEQRLRQPTGSPTAIDRRGTTITCDHMSGVCYDRMGAGYGLTRMYLSEAEADRLLKRLQPWKPEEPVDTTPAPTEPAPAE